MSEHSEKETMDAGRWKIPENLSRYLRAVAVGKGAVARLAMLLGKPKREEGPERRSCGSERRNVIGLEVRNVEV